MQPETSRFPTPEYLVVNVKPTLNASQANSLGLRILQDSVAFSSVDVACAPRLRGQTDGYFGLTRKHSCRTYGVLPIATNCFQCAMGFQHYITHCTCCAVCVDNDVLCLIVCTASKSTRLASIPILMAFFVVSKLTHACYNSWQWTKRAGEQVCRHFACVQTGSFWLSTQTANSYSSFLVVS